MLLYSLVLLLLNQITYANSPANSLVIADTVTFAINNKATSKSFDKNQRSSLDTNTFYINPSLQSGYTGVLDNHTRKKITINTNDGSSLPNTTNSTTTTTATNTSSNSGWWQPRASDKLKWQLQLQGDIQLISDVKVYAADSTASQASINAAKAAGAKLKCYISAGSAENWRSDYTSIPSYVIGNAYQGWPGEWWLNTRDINALAPVMRARMDTCKAKGFDAIDADNVNGYVNNTGFSLSRADSVAYIKWLAAESHARGMAFSLKNSESLIDDVIDQIDMLQTESCYVYGNCVNAAKMTARNKPVFAVEYQQNINSSNFTQNACPTAVRYNFSMIYRDVLLFPGSVYQSCN